MYSNLAYGACVTLYLRTKIWYVTHEDQIYVEHLRDASEFITFKSFMCDNALSAACILISHKISAITVFTEQSVGIKHNTLLKKNVSSDVTQEVAPV